MDAAVKLIGIYLQRFAEVSAHALTVGDRSHKGSIFKESLNANSTRNYPITYIPRWQAIETNEDTTFNSPIQYKISQMLNQKI